jgi:hypothetical protein
MPKHQDGFTSYRFGEEAVMPENQPFRLSIVGVPDQYTLRHRIGDDGKIRMSVDRVDQASVADRRSMHDARRAPHVIHDEGDNDALDPITGLIRDGHGIRVKLADANRNSPLVITTGIDWGRDDFNRDGTLKRRNHRDDNPQSRRRRKVQARDPMGREACTYEEETDDHRPGHRFGDAAGRATVDAAYTSYVEDLTTAWMSPEQRAQNVSDAQRGTAHAQLDGTMSARDAYVAETINAWRPKDADLVTGAPTQAVETMPAGAYIKVGLGANEGDTVTWNGAPAILRRRGNWLFPEVIKCWRDQGHTNEPRADLHAGKGS